jgi:hypothetical protein
MRSRYDFISQQTGRVSLGALFDAPLAGVAVKSPTLLAALGRAQEELDAVCGNGCTRAALEGYEASVLLALVLFRPIYFPSKHPIFQDRKVSVHGVLETGHGGELVKTPLGIQYDPENNWLAIFWKEALSGEGILSGLDTCPAWAKLKEGYEQRTGNALDWRWLRTCVEGHAWVVPGWRLKNMGYLTNTAWSRQDLDYDSISVVDLRGIEVIKGESADASAAPMISRPVRYAHHYTQNKEEFKDALKYRRAQLMAEARREKAGKGPKPVKKKMTPEQKDRAHATRIIYRLGRMFGAVGRGRGAVILDEDTCLDLFKQALQNYQNGNVRPSKKTVDRLIGELAEIAQDPNIPSAYCCWATLREGVTRAISEQDKAV